MANYLTEFIVNVKNGHKTGNGSNFTLQMKLVDLFIILSQYVSQFNGRNNQALENKCSAFFYFVP